jgi:hypothetical protein
MSPTQDGAIMRTLLMTGLSRDENNIHSALLLSFNPLSLRERVGERGFN